jgi:hypothetical protein
MICKTIPVLGVGLELETPLDGICCLLTKFALPQTGDGSVPAPPDSVVNHSTLLSQRQMCQDDFASRNALTLILFCPSIYRKQTSCFPVPTLLKAEPKKH